MTEFNDGGANLPNLYLISGRKIIDLSGLQDREQIESLGAVELAGCNGEECPVRENRHKGFI